MGSILLLVLGCTPTTGTTVVGKTDQAESCEVEGAISLADASVEGFHWQGGGTVWTVGAEISVQPCAGFAAEADVDWLLADVVESTGTLALSVDGSAPLSSGRHTGTVTIRDLDGTEALESIEVRLSVLATPEEPLSRNALVIGVDGLDGDEAAAAGLPVLERMKEGGLWSYSATTQQTGDSLSGPGWTSILTGVETSLHGVTENGSYSGRNMEYPTFLKRLRDEAELSAAVSIQWEDIYSIIGDGAYDDSASGSQDEVRDAMVSMLASGDHSLHFVHLDDVDIAGHSSGFSVSEPGYLEAMQQADSDIGLLVDAILDRPAIADESWLVLVTSDHGGDASGIHGPTGSDYQTIPLFIAGAGVQSAELDPGSGSHLDVHPALLAHFGLDVSDYPFVPPEGFCGNDLDDDGDGLTDCEDPDCEESADCGECPASDIGDPVGTAVLSSVYLAGDDYAGSCGGGGQADLAFRWTAPSAGTYVFDTMEWYQDTVLYLMDAECGEELACNDNLGGVTRSAVSAELDGGEQITVVLDSVGQADQTTGLSIYPAADSCPDGYLDPGEEEWAIGFEHRDTAHLGSCPPAIGVHWYSWTAPETGSYGIDTYGSEEDGGGEFDTVLYVLDSCNGSELACNDDGSQSYNSEVEVEAEAGQELFIGVGSFAGRVLAGDLSIRIGLQ
jgi:hypothetical protein